MLEDIFNKVAQANALYQEALEVFNDAKTVISSTDRALVEAKLAEIEATTASLAASVKQKLHGTAPQQS